MTTRIRMMFASALAVVFALALFNAASPLLQSQEITANIVGTVTDASGAPIKGAVVVASDVDRGTTWNQTTNDSGAYNILRLPIGTYVVKW